MATHRGDGQRADTPAPNRVSCAALHDGPGVYSVFGDSTPPVAYYLQSVDDSESCARGSHLFAVDLAGGEPRRLATLDGAIVPLRGGA